MVNSQYIAEIQFTDGNDKIGALAIWLWYRKKYCEENLNVLNSEQIYFGVGSCNRYLQYMI